MVSAAIETAVSASISTPVRSAIFTVAKIATPSSTTLISTFTLEIAIGWQSGINSGVFFAPIIPAIRAVEITSPLGVVPETISPRTSLVNKTFPEAVAVRTVSARSDTSTIWASP